MTEGSPFRMDTAATARPVAILCMAGHCLFQALDAFSRPRKGEGGAAFPSVISPSPPGAKHSGCASSHALPGDMAGRTDHAGISETGEPVRMGGRMDRMSVARDRPMQETAIADGVGERLSLEGDPVFEAPQTPYKKMPSWGGMRQAGCGEAKTVEGALRSAIKRFRFAADRLGTLFRVRKKDS